MLNRYGQYLVRFLDLLPHLGGYVSLDFDLNWWWKYFGAYTNDHNDHNDLLSWHFTNSCFTHGHLSSVWAEVPWIDVNWRSHKFCEMIFILAHTSYHPTVQHIEQWNDFRFHNRVFHKHPKLATVVYIGIRDFTTYKQKVQQHNITSVSIEPRTSAIWIWHFALWAIEACVTLDILKLSFVPAPLQSWT